MLDYLWTEICLYSGFYRDYAMSRWNSITPREYGILLIGVGVFGWFLLRSASRK